MNIYLVTQNKGKLAAAQHAFAGTDITLLSVDKDYPEIQATTSEEIAAYTAKAAASELGMPAIREDHSLYLNALGVPGLFMAYFEKKVTAAQLLAMLQNFPDRTGYFEVATTYATPDGSVATYVFQVPFTLATEERGDLQSGWSRLIILEGETRTLAEYPESERVHIWEQNFCRIAQSLNKK